MRFYPFCFYLLLCNCLLFSNISFSQNGGESLFNFFNVSGSARVAALGGSLISLKDTDPSLIINNPAVLDSSFDKMGLATYQRYFAGSNYGNLIYVKRHKFGMLSYNLNFMNYGSFDKRDAGGNKIGVYNAGDYGFNVSYGKNLDSNFSYGVNIKTLFSQIDQSFSFAVALDASIMYVNKKNGYIITAVLKNLGYQLSPFIANQRYNLPLDLQLGASYKLKYVPVRISLTATNLTSWNLAYSDTLGVGVEKDLFTQTAIQTDLSPSIFSEIAKHLIVGVEIYPTKTFFLRLGFNYRRRFDLADSRFAGTSGISWGFGFRIQKYHISYGSEGFHKSGSSNYLTIIRKF